jgi:hypothetical protein
MRSPDARRVLTDPQILSIWDRGYNQTPAERALTMLESVPRLGGEHEPETLSTGERDAELARLYGRTFGERVTALTHCGNCGELLDLSFELSEVAAGYGDTRCEWQVSGGMPVRDVRYRLPSSGDLALASRAPSATAARGILLERCVISADCQGASIHPTDLPEEVLALLGEAMAAHDPQSDVLLDTVCPECHAHAQVSFDIVRFMWSKIAERARQVLVDVHVLALTYGWSEAEILALPRARRETYLALLRG